jgi:hypothetical protein
LISTALSSRTCRSAEDLHGQRAFQSGESFIHGIFRRLREVKDYSRVLLDFFLQIRGQFGLVVNRSPRPGAILVRSQPDVKLAVEKSCGVGAVVGTGQLRAHLGDHGVSHQDFSDLRSELGSLLERDGIGHGGAHPHGSFVEMRHEFAADEGNQK